MADDARIGGFQGVFGERLGPWLGETEPSTAPSSFASDLFDTDLMSFGTIFSAAGDEFFFGFQRPGMADVHDILCSRLIDGRWTDPERLPFNSDAMDGDHCLSTDGKRIFWRSWRPLANERPEEAEERAWSYLWWAERTADGWGDARLLECGGRAQRTGYPAIGASDTLYFPARGRGGKASIFRSRPVDGRYAEPEEIISGMKVGGDMCIAPDESLLVITCEGGAENLGKGDLFVSRRRPDDTWTPLRHAGNTVNVPGAETYTHCPAISPDGRYLFYRVFDFGTKRSCVFWVDMSVLDPSAPEP